MKPIPILILLLLFSTQGISQNSFGIEIRTSRNITYNSSAIEGGGYGYSGYEVTKEGNPTTSSYSIGLIYSPNLRSTFKLHLGKHQNGRIIDLTEFDDTFSFINFENVNLPYNYLQITPSYSYRVINGKINVPIELGLSLNKRIKEDDIFYIGINEYNFDLRISSGIQYKINDFEIGSKLVYSRAFKSYQDKEYVNGEYIPHQLGIEVSFGYTFRIKEKITNNE